MIVGEVYVVHGLGMLLVTRQYRDGTFLAGTHRFRRVSDTVLFDVGELRHYTYEPPEREWVWVAVEDDFLNL
jgi:hypothetical protein